MRRGDLWVYLIVLAAALFAEMTPEQSRAGEPVIRQHLTDERGDSRRYSRAVATQGGTTIWLAGQTTVEDADGNPIHGDFEAQTREVFRLIGKNLARFDATFSDIVTMTIYVQDLRIGDTLLEIKGEYFGDGPYPSSALIGVVGFARKGVVVEIKATAVVGEKAQQEF